MSDGLHVGQFIPEACAIVRASQHAAVESQPASPPASHLVRSHMQMRLPVDSPVIRQFGRTKPLSADP